jgi:aminoglycoside phosphotransferase (APT) family kinase protein
MVDLNEAKAWIERTTGGSVVEIVRLASGASRGMFIVTMAQGRDLILRVDLGSGMMADTELTLAREAEVYRALTDRPVPTAGFVAASDDGKWLLIERAPGDFDLLALAETERTAICDRFVDSLAGLHMIDVATLDLPSVGRPVGPRDHALLELDLWQKIRRDRVKRPAPLADCAFAIMRELAPAWDGPASLCHGDVGPKNFLFEAGEITALIDWEFAHLGDPMDDLAWWVFRGHEWLGAGGDLPGQLRRWSARTGIAIDPHRIAYYRALVLLRWYVMILAALDNGSSAQDRLPYLSLVPVLDVKLACAVAGLLAIDLGPYPLLDEGDAPLTGEALAIFRDDVADVIAPALDDVEALRRVNALKNYADHFAAADRHGAAIRAGDLDDLTRLTGAAPDDIEAGEHILAQAGWADAERRRDVLTYFMRRGVRHAALWPITRARALTPPWTTAYLGLDHDRFRLKRSEA